MRRPIFIGPLRPCLATATWPHPQLARLLSDDLDALKAFAPSIGLAAKWLQWDDDGTPFFKLTPNTRTKAFLAGALEITADDEGALHDWWRDKHMAVLRKLQRPPAFLIRK